MSSKINHNFRMWQLLESIGSHEHKRVYLRCPGFSLTLRATCIMLEWKIWVSLKSESALALKLFDNCWQKLQNN